MRILNFKCWLQYGASLAQRILPSVELSVPTSHLVIPLESLFVSRFTPPLLATSQLDRREAGSLMRCSLNHLARLEFDFDVLKAETEHRVGRAQSRNTRAASSAAEMQMDSIWVSFYFEFTRIRKRNHKIRRTLANCKV